ncbi:MAG: hypothetical protein JW885_03500 [Deltaproteobacteria bacterium]|nr:hypothetical protein [Candidatus Zymogenaceae bacterium]
MERQSFARRFILPVLIVLIVAAGSWIGYHVAWRLDNRSLHDTLAQIFGIFLFFSVAFGPLVIYPLTYRRGAGALERVIACLVTPLAWATKDFFRMLAAFTVTESLYFYLNPLNIWLILLLTAEMAFLEIGMRRGSARRGEDVKVFSLPVIAVGVLAVCLVFALYAWGRGENIFSYYLVVYRMLFGPGAGL